MTAVKNKVSQLPLTKLAKKLNSPLKCKTKPTGKNQNHFLQKMLGFFFFLSLFFYRQNSQWQKKAKDQTVAKLLGACNESFKDKNVSTVHAKTTVDTSNAKLSGEFAE